MIDQIKKLEKSSRLLEPGSELRSQWNTEVIEYADRFINTLGNQKAYEIEDTHADRIYELDICDEPTSLTTLIEGIDKGIDTAGINPASAGHMGYIPGGGLYPAALGDYLAAVSNRYAGVYYAAPGAVRLENMLIAWMSRLMGYPKESVGNLTSGGSIANLIAIVTAREAHQIKARDIETSVIYLSEQVHHSIHKAIKIAGLTESKVRYIPLDKQLKLSVSALEQQIQEDVKQGLKPFFVNATVGTTNSGAIDPLESIANVAQTYGLWLHVDACYGGFFKLLPELAPKFNSIERADSITLDPHKTLFLPFGTGAVLIKNTTQALNAYRHAADYMQDTVNANEEISPSDVSPELTKHFRGLRLWLPLKLFGLSPFKAALQEKLLLAQYFYHELQTRRNFELGPEPELSIVMFRYTDGTEDSDRFNKRLISSIQKDGRVFLSSTSIDGTFWIRAAIVIYRTHLEQIHLLLNIIDEKVDELKST